MDEKLEWKLKEIKAQRKADVAFIDKILASPQYGKVVDELEKLIITVREDETCDRDTFVIAALIMAASMDMSDDTSDDRQLWLARRFMLCVSAVRVAYAEKDAGWISPEAKA